MNKQYQAMKCKQIPTNCCDYAVVDHNIGQEVCRVWMEDDARKLESLLNNDYSEFFDDEVLSQVAKSIGNTMSERNHHVRARKAIEAAIMYIKNKTEEPIPGRN